MLFNSLEFLIFFPLVVIIYFACPRRFRWVLLLGASYYFYAAWKLEYIVLIITSTLVDYCVALRMEKTPLKSHRKRLLSLSLLTNLGLLFTFKYFNFFNDSLRAAFNSVNVLYGVPDLEVLLPVGISFYTFQTLSYTIEVYRGNVKPEKHLGIFALYVSFFPQLVAGPIERPDSLLPQFFKKYDFDYERIADGLTLMLWGMFKKVVIADRLAIFVDKIYTDPSDWYGSTLILATYCFAFQIYCDFSGYSDIAIGAARVMGYDLRINFKEPYASQSIQEFWRRWHISLSTWFRDYLYLPLGGNRVAKWRWFANLFIVFVVSGLWHGANWTFVVWGALHGFYYLLSIWTKPMRDTISHVFHLERSAKIQRALNVFITFHLVVFAWIFFRANSIADAFLVIENISQTNWLEFGMLLSLIFSLIFLVGSFDVIRKPRPIRAFLSEKPIWFRWGIYLVLALSIMNLGVPNEIPFIYFQF